MISDPNFSHVLFVHKISTVGTSTETTVFIITGDIVFFRPSTRLPPKTRLFTSEVNQTLQVNKSMRREDANPSSHGRGGGEGRGDRGGGGVGGAPAGTGCRQGAARRPRP